MKSMIATLSVLPIIFVLSIMIERVFRRSRRELINPGWYLMTFAIAAPLLALVYQTVPVVHPLAHAAYVSAGGLAGLIAQCFFGKRIEPRN